MHRVSGLAAALPVLAVLALLPEPALSDQNEPRLAELFHRLAAAEDEHQAAPIEREIWSIWLECGDAQIDASMNRAIQAMNAGDHARARRGLDTIVHAKPEFAEGFNQRATLRFLMGELEASVQDIERTLRLEPRHFGALSGLAMIRESQGRPFEALEALEQLIRLHPRLPHLQQRIDRLTRQLGEPV